MKENETLKPGMLITSRKLKDEFRILSIRRHQKVQESLHTAFQHYLQRFSIEHWRHPELDHWLDSPKYRWGIVIDKEDYTQLKVLSVNHDIGIFDMMNSALLYELERSD